MMHSLLLCVFTFALFLTIPGAVTGTIFLASTIYYTILAVWQGRRIQ